MKYNIANLGQYGMAQDQAPVDLPDNAFSYAQNCRFAGGYAGRMAGEIPVFGTPSTTPLFVLPMTFSTSRFVIYPGTNKIYCHDGTTETDITGTVPTGANTDKWTGDVFNSLAILNNQIDIPQYWDGTIASNFAAFPTWDATWRAKAIGTYKNYIVALNITKGANKYPVLVKWSTAANPGTMPGSWDEADPTTDAGEFPLADTQGDIVDGKALSSTFIIYKTDSYYAMQFIGGTAKFSFNLIEKNTGLLSQNCVVAFPGGHACIGNGDIYVHGGGASRSIVSQRDKDWFFNNLDVDYRNAAFACVNHANKEVWFCAPDGSTSSCTYALVWNWESDTMGQRTVANLRHGNVGQIDVAAITTWDAFTDVWDSVNDAWSQLSYNPSEQRLVLASDNTKLYLPDRTSTFDSVEYTSSLQRSGLVLGDPTMVKTLTGIRPRIDAPTGTVIQFRAGSQKTPSDDVAWGGYSNYTVGTSFRADLFATGNYLAYEIRTTSGSTWRIKGMTIEFENVSEY